MSIRESGKASSSLGLQDFDLLRVIGRGSYAKVLLVRLKKTERIYAMKVVKKELVNDDEVGKIFINQSGNSCKELQCLAQGGSQASGSATLPENYTCGFSHMLYWRRLTRRDQLWGLHWQTGSSQLPSCARGLCHDPCSSIVGVSFSDHHCLQPCFCRIHVNKPGLLR